MGTRYRFGFDGQSAGTAVTTANANLSQIAPGGTAGTTNVFQTASPGDGTSFIRVTPVSGGTLLNVINQSGYNALKMKFRITATPTASANIGQLRMGTPDSPAVTLQILGTGRLLVTGWTSAASVVGVGWVRLHIFRADDGSILKVAYYIGESTTPVETWTGTPSVGSAPLGSFRFGRTASSTDTSPIDFDSIELEVGATDISTTPYGPDTTPAPVFTASGPASAEPLSTVTLTTSLTSGTPTSWTWTQLSGPAVTLTGTGGTRTFVAPGIMPPATLATFRASAVQNDSDPGTAEVSVSILPTTDWSRVPGGTWKPAPTKVLNALV